MNQMTASSTIDQLRLESLLETVQGAASVVILTHNDPDPDSIASALALQYVLDTLTGVNTVIAYGGIVGRAENRALVDYLALDMKLASELNWSEFDLVAVVDSQPGAGNNALPADRRADIIVDHHQPFREQSSLASHVDIRLEVGASSTILTGYVLAAGLDISPRLATALFYGIQTDTVGLSRDASDLDRTLYAILQPLVDVEELNTIERAQVPREYFRAFSEALADAEVYDGTVVVAHLGDMYRPDMAAEVADVLARLQHAQWILCSGVYGGLLMISIRSTLVNPEAGTVAQKIVRGIGEAGGHGSVAGGQVPLKGQDPDTLVKEIEDRFFAVLSCATAKREKLVPDDEKDWSTAGLAQN